jgi:ribonuclease E
LAKRILVSVDPYEARAVLMDGDRLANVEIESAERGKRKGNIYRARVTSVETSLDAAFVDYGASKDGFLPLDEVAHRSLALLGGGSGSRRPGVRQGDWILVQVIKEEFGKKGATLSMHISLPGRYVVVMPFSDRTGISRKLTAEERSRLRGVASQLKHPDGLGVIVRTSGEKESVEDLQTDLDQQLATWEGVIQRFKALSGPGEVHAESGLAVRFVRDYLSSDVTEILAEDEPSHRELLRFIEARMPTRRGLLRRYTGDLPLFLKYGVERQIESLLSGKVTLPTGGSIVIGQTEALVAIDVNSGRMKQRDAEDTAFRTNLEAAREIARQVVLRDLGGIIVVDFIDMESEAHDKLVEEELRASLAADKARLSFSRIGEFGLLAFSRQRIRQSVDLGSTLTCPTCFGTGRVRSPALLALSALRRVRERLATQAHLHPAYVEVRLPVTVANFLNNRKREDLVALEGHHGVVVDIVGDEDAAPQDLSVKLLPEVPADRVGLRRREEEPEDREETPNEEILPVVSPEASPEPRKSSLIKGLLKKVLGIEDPAPAEPVPARAVRQAQGRKDPGPVPGSVPVPVPAPPPVPEPPAVVAEELPKAKRGRKRRRRGRGMGEPGREPVTGQAQAPDPVREPEPEPVVPPPPAVAAPIPFGPEESESAAEPPEPRKSKRGRRRRGGRGRRHGDGEPQRSAESGAPEAAEPVPPRLPEPQPSPDSQPGNGKAKNRSRTRGSSSQGSAGRPPSDEPAPVSPAAPADRENRPKHPRQRRKPPAAPGPGEDRN